MWSGAGKGRQRRGGTVEVGVGARISKADLALKEIISQTD